MWSEGKHYEKPFKIHQHHKLGPPCFNASSSAAAHALLMLLLFQ